MHHLEEVLEHYTAVGDDAPTYITSGLRERLAVQREKAPPQSGGTKSGAAHPGKSAGTSSLPLPHVHVHVHVHVATSTLPLLARGPPLPSSRFFNQVSC